MFARVLLIGLVLVIAWAVFARTSRGSSPERVYVVRPYDTLWSIAADAYGGDPREGVWRIRERNHLTGTTITPGERLRLP